MSPVHMSTSAPTQVHPDNWPPTPATTDRQMRVLRERFAFAPELARAVADIVFAVEMRS